MILKIEQDTDAESPAGWDNKTIFLGTLPGYRSRLSNLPLASWDRGSWRFPVAVWRNGGSVRLCETAQEMRGCGEVVQVSRTEWPTMERARKAAESFVETWNQYLAGEVYGYVVKEGDTVLDSCWGFYGEDEAIREGKSAMAHLEANCNLHVQI